MAFIIDTYNKYNMWDRQHARMRFEINGQDYAIMEVELDWGQPVLAYRVDRKVHADYFIYNTLDEAKEFVRNMKALN